MRRFDDFMTIADFFPRSYLNGATAKMTWEEYVALPGGLHDARAKKQNVYRWAGVGGLPRFAVPMIATLQSSETVDGEGRETWKMETVLLSRGFFAPSTVLLETTGTKYGMYLSSFGDEIEYTN